MNKHEKGPVAYLCTFFIASLFSGCSGENTVDTTGDTTASPTASPAAIHSSAPSSEADSPYNYASGKFKADENGLALEKYDYELPITTADDVLTMWTVAWTPQYLPDDGYGSTELPKEV